MKLLSEIPEKERSLYRVMDCGIFTTFQADWRRTHAACTATPYAEPKPEFSKFNKILKPSKKSGGEI